MNNLEKLRTAVSICGGVTATATLIGVDRVTVHRYLRGDTTIPLSCAAILCDSTKGMVKINDIRPDVDWSRISRLIKAAGL